MLTPDMIQAECEIRRAERSLDSLDAICLLTELASDYDPPEVDGFIVILRAISHLTIWPIVHGRLSRDDGTYALGRASALSEVK